MWVRQCHKPSPSNHHLYREYDCHSQWMVCGIVLPTLLQIAWKIAGGFRTPWPSRHSLSHRQLCFLPKKSDVARIRKSCGVYPNILYVITCPSWGLTNSTNIARIARIAVRKPGNSLKEKHYILVQDSCRVAQALLLQFIFSLQLLSQTRQLFTWRGQPCWRNMP